MRHLQPPMHMQRFFSNGCQGSPYIDTQRFVRDIGQRLHRCLVSSTPFPLMFQLHLPVPTGYQNSALWSANTLEPLSSHKFTRSFTIHSRYRSQVSKSFSTPSNSRLSLSPGIIRTATNQDQCHSVAHDAFPSSGRTAALGGPCHSDQ